MKDLANTITEKYIERQNTISWLVLVLFTICSLINYLIVWNGFLNRLSLDLRKTESIVTLIPFSLIIENDDLYKAIDKAF